MAKVLIETMQRFNNLSTEIDAAYHSAAMRLGLSDSAMAILYNLLAAGGECMICDIIQLTGISKQTVNSSLRGLEADGNVTLSSIGRKKKVSLTAAGKALAEATAGRIIDIENGIFHSWTKEEKKIYIELTERYLTAFSAKINSLGKSST